MPLQHFKFQNTWNSAIQKSAPKFKNPPNHLNKQGIPGAFGESPVTTTRNSRRKKFLSEILPKQTGPKWSKWILQGAGRLVTYFCQVARAATPSFIYIFLIRSLFYLKFCRDAIRHVRMVAMKFHIFLRYLSGSNGPTKVLAGW